MSLPSVQATLLSFRQAEGRLIHLCLSFACGPRDDCGGAAVAAGELGVAASGSVTGSPPRARPSFEATLGGRAGRTHHSLQIVAGPVRGEREEGRTEGIVSSESRRKACLQVYVK